MVLSFRTVAILLTVGIVGLNGLGLLIDRFVELDPEQWRSFFRCKVAIMPYWLIANLLALTLNGFTICKLGTMRVTYDAQADTSTRRGGSDVQIQSIKLLGINIVLMVVFSSGHLIYQGVMKALNSAGLI